LNFSAPPHNPFEPRLAGSCRYQKSQDY
jgi:hypothetical protein